MPDERDRDRDAATDPIVTEIPISTAAQLATLAGKFPERYRIAGTLGTGGMGEVILATDTQIGREVAIKRMRLAPNAGSIARFEREAKIQARLEHPAIVPVHELANDAAGQPFFVMKRLAGTTLYDVIATRNAKFSRNKLLRSFADACLAVELAHSRGIVHRDLKPNNIMLGDFGETYVLDWGIARVLGEAETIEPAWRDTSVGGATQVGAIFGTPGYIAPEMLRGQPVDGRADVYALGCILFEILAGEPLLPPGRSGMTAALDDVDARPSVRAPDRNIPLELDSICVDATRTERDLRLPTARSLAERVEHFLDGDRDHAQRKALAEGHLATARAAIAAGDSEAQRALAMREAGSALALDPTGVDAAELVGRLMLEPPREVPREVEDRLAELDDRARRTKLSVVWPAHLMYLAFSPLLVLLGLHGGASIALLCTAIAINALVSFRLSRQREPISVNDMYFTVIVTALLIGTIARLFSPPLVAPGIATLATFMFAVDPRIRLIPLIGALMGAMLLPWALEIIGTWSRTLGSEHGDFMLHSEAFEARYPDAEIALAGFIATLVVFSATFARRVASSERSAVRALELQAWHLRQLVRR